MAYLLMVPAVLSSLVLAAHFLRMNSYVMIALSLLIIPLAIIPRRWAVRTAQVMLLLGALEWLMTTVNLVGARAEAGAPWKRMAIILGTVQAFTAASAVLLELPPVRRRCMRRRADTPGLETTPPSQGAC